ncbi:MAG TPA: HEAT repeat domain-containing protein [Rariglobus sp.]|jgi:HEAT repeat protein|nr:HEAT repeat domain-containing protein [Rariglobus sp.]
MKPIPRLIFFTVMFATLIAAYFYTRTMSPSAEVKDAAMGQTTTPSTPKTPPSSKSDASTHLDTPPPSTAPPLVGHIPAQVRIPAGKPLPEIFPHQAERDAIQTLAITYDPKYIPKIATYLNHSDETVRAAAINALVQIGNSDAIPYLKAAELNAEGDEADRLHQVIEFLSIPVAKTGK